ncbi:Y+L amino acid transporter 2-like [Diadema setosum]|uniref:Y+L amino acid transporter 2-like n=1 Tax=Diadema setosum TaxID=31175 RepID=UPI003B3B65DF
MSEYDALSNEEGSPPPVADPAGSSPVRNGATNAGQGSQVVYRPINGKNDDPEIETKLADKAKETKGDDSSSNDSAVELKREISLMGGVAVNVGVIIGSGIFISPKGVLIGSGSVGLTMVNWSLCGVFSLIGALCLAELGTMIPSSGGFYVYAQQSFGNFWAFLLLWVMSGMMQPVAIAVITLTCAQYVLEPFFMLADCNPPAAAINIIAICAQFTVMYVNCRSVKWATSVQSIFTVAKLSALFIIIISGLVLLCKGNTQNFENAFEGTDLSGLGVAFYSGLFSYAGWYSLNIVVEELKDPYKNLPRAIYITIFTVTIVYVLTNLAYFAALSPEELLASNAVAVTYGAKVLGSFAWIMPVAVALSTFGSANGNMLTCSRLFFVGAREKHLPNLLSMINIERNTPVPSLLFTSLLTILYSLAGDVFTLINYFNFVTWFSSALAVAGLLWLRYKEPDRPRPYKVNILLPIIFVIACIFLLVMGTIAAPLDTVIGIAIMCTGIPVYFFIVRPKNKPLWALKANDFVTRWFQKLMLVCAEER